jgi:hypothetical protein
LAESEPNSPDSSTIFLFLIGPITLLLNSGGSFEVISKAVANQFGAPGNNLKYEVHWGLGARNHPPTLTSCAVLL